MEQSEKWGVWAQRGAGSIFGLAEAWLKSFGRRIEFATKGQAAAEAARLSKEIRSANVRYSAVRIEE